MRKNELEINGLVDLSAERLVKTNGGVGSTHSAAHSHAKTALNNVLTQLTANGANAHAIAAVKAVIAKLP